MCSLRQSVRTNIRCHRTVSIDCFLCCKQKYPLLHKNVIYKMLKLPHTKTTFPHSSIGTEHELKLKHYLSKYNIVFADEDRLRSRGFDKTPDIKLEVPIAVNGFVINWIESKGRFGSHKIHEKYVKDQLSSYWNRFGPGLVIYWFGFMDTLTLSSEQRFIIMDHFPTNITYMDPTLICPAFK